MPQSLDANEARLPMPDLFGATPKRGIRCPYNRTDEGPAKRVLWCLIWKDWNQYSKLAPESTQFCRSICHYGKNYAQQRTQVERSAAGWRAQHWQLLKHIEWLSSIRKWWQTKDWLRGPLGG